MISFYLFHRTPSEYEYSRSFSPDRRAVTVSWGGNAGNLVRFTKGGARCYRGYREVPFSKKMVRKAKRLAVAGPSKEYRTWADVMAVLVD